MSDKIYNLKHLKDLYDIGVRTWREYIQAKELRAFKIARQFFVKKEDLRKFFDKREAYKWRSQKNP